MAAPLVLPRMIRMRVRSPEDESTSDIDDQSDDGYCNGFRKMDCLRRENALNGGERHHRGNPQQEQGAGIARENFDFPSAERKARISRIAPGGDVCECAEADGKGMRAHVP